MVENDISGAVIGAAIRLHKLIGPGLLEAAYENALAYELKQLGFHVEQQISMPFIYKEVRLNIGYRADMLVNELVVVEIKSIEKLLPVHFSQVLTYLRLSGLKLGLLINFNSKILKDGIHRIANNL
jgi:GxxExxY protein